MTDEDDKKAEIDRTELEARVEELDRELDTLRLAWTTRGQRAVLAEAEIIALRGKLEQMKTIIQEVDAHAGRFIDDEDVGPQGILYARAVGYRRIKEVLSSGPNSRLLIDEAMHNEWKNALG